MSTKNQTPRIALEIKDQIAFVTLNRADKLNALDMPMFEAIVNTTKQNHPSLKGPVLPSIGPFRPEAQEIHQKAILERPPGISKSIKIAPRSF